MPQYQPYQRFSDNEREKVAARLKDAYADGRLDHIEFSTRLDDLYKAQTYGQLEPLVSDLPAASTYKTPEVAKQSPSVAPGQFEERTPAQADRGVGHDLSRVFFGGMGSVFVICVIIWAISGLASGSFARFWPVWLLIPVAISVLGTLRRRNDGGSGRDRRRELDS